MVHHVDSCPHVRCRIVWMSLISLAVAAAASQARAGPPMTRAEAVAFLLDPESGIDLTKVTNIWSPFVDFSALGPGFEGLLPAGSSIAPAYLNTLPFPGSTVDVPIASYFFWVDDSPKGEFTHATRFVLVDATSGALGETQQGWWPLIDTGGGQVAYFERDVDRTSAFAAGADNPDGLIFGFAFPPAALPPLEDPPKREGEPANSCALVVRAGADAYMSRNVDRFVNDLKNVEGVPQDRIKKVNDGNQATEQQFCDALDALATMDPPCEKILIRWTGHGAKGSLAMKDSELTAEELCDKLMELAQLGVPVCMVINACHSGSMLEGAFSDWDLPAGSSIITSCTADETSWAGKHNDESTDPATEFDESVFLFAFSQCKNDSEAPPDGADDDEDGYVSDREALDWVQTVLPCYDFKGQGGNSYPGGAAPDGQPAGDVTTPQSVQFDGPTCDRVIAKLERGIDKLDRALIKLAILPPDPPQDLLEIILGEVIEQLDDTIVQLESAITQLEQIRDGGGGNCPSSPPIDPIILKLEAVIDLLERAIEKLQFILDNPSLPPDQVAGILDQVIAQLEGAIGLLESAIEQLVPTPTPCPADIAPTTGICETDGDGTVGPGDLGELLANWGSSPSNVCADIAPVGAPDGAVGPGDLGELLANWGACPTLICGGDTTHSFSDQIVPGIGVACASDDITTFNAFARSYEISNFTVCSVQVGIQGNSNSFPLCATCTIYSDIDGGNPRAPDIDLFPLRIARFDIPLGFSGIIDVEVVPLALTSATLVVEIAVDPGVDGGVWPGSNSFGESAPTWLRAPSCLFNEFVTMASIGFPQTHWVQHINGFNSNLKAQECSLFCGDAICDATEDCASCEVDCGQCPPSPPNDNCDSAQPITLGSFSFSNLGATSDGPAPCGLLGSDIWFDFVAPFPGAIVIDTFGSGFDTVLAAYDGCGCPVGPLLTCNDDANDTVQSQIIFNVLPGQCYKVQLGGFNGDEGIGVINVDQP